MLVGVEGRARANPSADQLPAAQATESTREYGIAHCAGDGRHHYWQRPCAQCWVVVAGQIIGISSQVRSSKELHRLFLVLAALLLEDRPPARRDC